MRTPEAVFEHHLEVFGAGDVDGILTDYSDDSVMLYDDRAWHGLTGARDFFNMWLDDLLPVGCRFEVTARQCTTDLIYIQWTAESDDWVFDFGTNTFLITDDRILRQTVATSHRRK